MSTHASRDTLYGEPAVAVYAKPEIPLSTRLLMVARGLWAVLLLLLSAAASLCSAIANIPAGRARALGHVIADEYRAGRAGAIDAIVVEDGGDRS
jgi:hypothetical protein